MPNQNQHVQEPAWLPLPGPMTRPHCIGCPHMRPRDKIRCPFELASAGGAGAALLLPTSVLLHPHLKLSLDHVGSVMLHVFTFQRSDQSWAMPQAFADSGKPPGDARSAAGWEARLSECARVLRR